MRVLGIIPARGGSKGIPGKNLTVIDGKPLICYTIETALESSKLDTICVSSDHHDVLEVASRYEVKIHERPQRLATDQSPITETIQDVLSNICFDGYFDAFMLLQPTAPIRTGYDVDTSIKLLESDSEVNSVISVCPMNEMHPARMYWKGQHSLEPILPEFEESRRQDIPIAYYRNGSIYLVRTKAFKANRSVMVKPIAPYIMPISHMLNIDEPRDILIAEVLLPMWKTGNLI